MKNPKYGEIWLTINNRIVRIIEPMDSKNICEGEFMNDGPANKLSKGSFSRLSEGYLMMKITPEQHPEYFI